MSVKTHFGTQATYSILRRKGDGGGGEGKALISSFKVRVGIHYIWCYINYSSHPGERGGSGGRGEVTSFSFEVGRFIVLMGGSVNHLQLKNQKKTQQSCQPKT